MTYRCALTVLCAFFSVLLCCCSDDESYTVNANDKLAFSTDTVNFDTVFTTLGSSTRSLKVYNNNSKAVRITDVSLASGGESGYRINADGQSGPSVQNLEIAKSDSMYVFIEVTPDRQDSETPEVITDRLVFTLESGVRQEVVLTADAQDFNLVESAEVTGEMTLHTSKAPYVVMDSLVVRKGGKLTIEPGVTLCFHKGAGLVVEGELECQGTLSQPITFRCDRMDRLFSYLPYDRTEAQWEGVRIAAESGDCTFSYTDIHGGNYGVVCDSASVDSKKITVTNCKFSNVSGNALELNNIRAEVANSEFSNAGGNCVRILGGDATFVHCTIAQFYPWGSNGAALYFTNAAGTGSVNLVNASFTNCIVSGDGQDEVSCVVSDDKAAALNFKFSHCLLLTVEPGDTYASCFDQCVLETDGDAAYKGGNFRLIDNDIYLYDFGLTEQSKAVGLASGEAAAAYPYDRNGNLRSGDGVKADAGCYQFMRDSQ